MKFAYLIGAPGAGKSTVAAALRSFSAKQHLIKEPVPHITAWRGGRVWFAEIGMKRAAFSGTDALAMDIINKAVEWVHTHPYVRFFAEGDRLANARFFAEIKSAGYDLRVFHLTATPETLQVRRAARGSDQNPTWLKGRETKVDSLAQLFQAEALDGEEKPLLNAGILRRYLT